MPPPRTVRQPSLHCGISFSPRAAQGQSRQIGMAPTVAARPLSLQLLRIYAGQQTVTKRSAAR
jgi:hypothetical protein